MGRIFLKFSTAYRPQVPEVVAEVKQRQKNWAVLSCPPAASLDPGERKQLSWWIGMSQLRCSTFYGLFSCDSSLTCYSAVPRMSLRERGCMNKESNGGAYFRQKSDEDEERVWCLESLVFIWFVAWRCSSLLNSACKIALIILTKNNTCTFSGCSRGKNMLQMLRCRGRSSTNWPATGIGDRTLV